MSVPVGRSITPEELVIAVFARHMIASSIFLKVKHFLINENTLSATKSAKTYKRSKQLMTVWQKDNVL